MKLTTKDIIKMLSFDDELKKALLDRFDTLSPDQKFTIEDIIWNMYYALYKLKLQENTEVAWARVKKKQEKFDNDFYKRIGEQTEKEMQGETVLNVEKTDLGAARRAMEAIIKEMQAVKTAK